MMIHPFKQFEYCPKCGSAHFIINNEKSKRCNDCGFVYYFNPSAAVVGFIQNNKNELLICRRAKDPAKGTFDLPGGFLDMFETGEEGIAREIKEETNIDVVSTKYLFSIPNTYVYSTFLVHTLDLFFQCKVNDTFCLKAADDVEEVFFVPLDRIEPDSFGLESIRKGVGRFLEQNDK